MSASSFKAAVERNIAIWFLGTLATGVIAGVGIMQTLQQYTGMVMLTKKVDEERRSAMETCKKALASRNDDNTTLTARVSALSREIEPFAQCRDTLAQCKVELTDCKSAPASDPHELERARASFRKLEAQAKALRFQISEAKAAQNRLQTENTELKSTISTLRSHNTALSSPSITSPIVVYKSSSAAPNQLVEYFDGALTVAAESIDYDVACLRISGTSGCKSAKVGDVVPVTVGDKTYGIRVDRLQVSDAALSFKRTTDSRNRITLTILLLGRGT